MTDTKSVTVTCECEGTGFIAVADCGGDGVDHVECAEHNPAYQPAETSSLMGKITQGASELERLINSDPWDFLGRNNN